MGITPVLEKGLFAYPINETHTNIIPHDTN